MSRRRSEQQIHVEPVETVGLAAGFAGLSLTRQAWAHLARCAGWLIDEAIPAGALGPREGGAIWGRHIADSLTFASGWKGIELPGWIWDLGSGAGLPGIPLAIAWPGTLVTLVERSSSRCQLLRRAARVLELPNVEVLEGDADRLGRRVRAVVARGFRPPAAMVNVAARVLEPGGRAVVGGSHRRRPEVKGAQVIEIPPEILDHPAWLLMMRAP